MSIARVTTCVGVAGLGVDLGQFRVGADPAASGPGLATKKYAKL